MNVVHDNKADNPVHHSRLYVLAVLYQFDLSDELMLRILACTCQDSMIDELLISETWSLTIINGI
jgi:hypothetical protein